MDLQFIRGRISVLRTKKNVSEYRMSTDLEHSKSYMQSISSGRSVPSLGEFLYTGETPLATFTQNEFTDATLTKYFGLEIMDRWSRAGDYVGTMQYSFECSPI